MHGGRRGVVPASPAATGHARGYIGKAGKADEVEGFRTDEGATATLLADPGRLGHVDARRLEDGTLVAPPSRVMLDLLLESRGTATAELFADLWRDDT